MDIGIVGLGLMGGSLAKALSAKTAHRVFGLDTNEAVLAQAEAQKCIVGASEAQIRACDVVFVCLYPKAAADFIVKGGFKGIVSDICGVKGYMYERIKGRGIDYVGVHPMAGKEHQGFDWSDEKLFEGASLILTKEAETREESLETIAEIGREIGFGSVVVTDCAAHDRVIAYTSQLAHVVSSAYIKSETADRYKGYSAGSFLDMTRVARLEPTMWTQLFLMNKEALSGEIGAIIERLGEFKAAIDAGDEEALFALLKEGSDRKIRLEREK